MKCRHIYWHDRQYFLKSSDLTYKLRSLPCLSTYHSKANAASKRRWISSKASHTSKTNPQYGYESSKGLLGGRAKKKEADREFFTDLLSSAATKRDAKAYLSRLQSPIKTKPFPTTKVTAPQPRVNLGNLFGRSRAIEDSPVFSQYDATDAGFQELETLHVALVKIADVDTLADNVISGIAETLIQLHKLSMAPCVLLESSSTATTTAENTRQKLALSADRLMEAISSNGDIGSRKVDNIFSLDDKNNVSLAMRKLLFRPLRGGQIPVILPLAYSVREGRLEQIPAADAMLALIRDLAGLNFKANPDEDPYQTATAISLSQKQVSLDRIITIDAAGGIPTTTTADGKHVFINLEQEYDDIKNELETSLNRIASDQHASNLKMLKTALSILPPASSGLMTTYEEAANAKRLAQEPEMSNVGTRRQKNALIHNLLTDKPAYSSSLPSGRLTRNVISATPPSVSTFVKRGMPVTILPDPHIQPWTPTSPRIKLTDPRIDLGRLIYLIEDSFNRKLDVEDYLKRVNNRIAGVIIAGEYEGGALLTWETPSNLSPAEANDPNRLVPYLDKFAVLKRSQGAGGVADIVFNAMTRVCFPEGVCWRSRKNNPVNKWYFERSAGTWKIPDMGWTMFWTTPGVPGNGENKEGGRILTEYESVCRGVIPSWADKAKAAD